MQIEFSESKFELPIAMIVECPTLLEIFVCRYAFDLSIINILQLIHRNRKSIEFISSNLIIFRYAMDTKNVATQLNWTILSTTILKVKIASWAISVLNMIQILS